MNQLSHQSLVQSLTLHCFGRGLITFAEVGIGSRWLQEGKVPVPDVMTMRCSYTQPDLTIYEVKANKSDFLGDINRAKYKRYLPICNRFYFAAPRGLLTRDMMPQGIGLIVYNPDKDSWHVTKAGRRREADLASIEWQALMMAKYATDQQVRKLTERIVWEENLPLRKRVKSLGWDVANKLEQAEKIEKRIRELKIVIARGLGLNEEKLLKEAEWRLEHYLRTEVRRLTIPVEKELCLKIIGLLSNFVTDEYSSSGYRIVAECKKLCALLETKNREVEVKQ